MGVGCIRQAASTEKVAQSSKRKAVELNFLAQLKRQSGDTAKQHKAQYKKSRKTEERVNLDGSPLSLS